MKLMSAALSLLLVVSPGLAADKRLRPPAAAKPAVKSVQPKAAAKKAPAAQAVARKIAPPSTPRQPVVPKPAAAKGNLPSASKSPAPIYKQPIVMKPNQTIAPKGTPPKNILPIVPKGWKPPVVAKPIAGGKAGAGRPLPAPANVANLPKGAGYQSQKGIQEARMREAAAAANVKKAIANAGPLKDGALNDFRLDGGNKDVRNRNVTVGAVGGKMIEPRLGTANDLRRDLGRRKDLLNDRAGSGPLTGLAADRFGDKGKDPAADPLLDPAGDPAADAATRIKTPSAVDSLLSQGGPGRNRPAGAFDSQNPLDNPLAESGADNPAGGSPYGNNPGGGLPKGLGRQVDLTQNPRQAQSSMTLKDAAGTIADFTGAGAGIGGLYGGVPGAVAGAELGAAFGIGYVIGEAIAEVVNEIVNEPKTEPIETTPPASPPATDGGTPPAGTEDTGGTGTGTGTDADAGTDASGGTPKSTPNPNAEDRGSPAPSQLDRWKAKQNSSVNTRAAEKLMSQLPALRQAKINPVPLDQNRRLGGSTSFSPDQLPDPSPAMRQQGNRTANGSGVTSGGPIAPRR